MSRSRLAPLLAGCAVLGLAPGPLVSTPGLHAGLDPGPALEVRNRGALAVNVELVGASGIHFQTVFLGRIEAGRSRVFDIQGATAGDSVWMRAKPIDGSAPFEERGVVLRPGAVWEIPPHHAGRPEPA